MVIIHAGMHKTGSSSIQDTFAKLDGDRVDLPPWHEVNYSAWFNKLFFHLTQYEKRIDPEKIVDTRHRLLGRTLERRRSGQALRPLLISGEIMSSTGAKRGLTAMADFLREHREKDVRVIAYVRPPRSFIPSWFQQRCKLGLGRTGSLATTLNRNWPNYRARFEKLDTVFGRENVTLKPFQRERLEGGDVVLDFAREVGVALDPGEVVYANESMSLEAVALLHVYWRFGQQLDRRQNKNPLWRKRFIGCISGLGSRQFVPVDARTARVGGWRYIQPCSGSSRRFVFADTLTDPVVEAHRADLDWMEARLGVPLSEPAVPEGEGIGSEAELIAVALAARPLLEDRIAQVIAALPAHEIPDCDLSVPDVPDADRPVYELARRLDFLRDLLKPPALEQGRRKKKPSRREQG